MWSRLDVEFPDGTVISVPSWTRVIPNKEIGGPGASSFEEVPKDDPEWEFYCTIMPRKWRARPR